LKHMVADKINYRQGGKIVSMTKQPTKGRGNEGGLRIGEMETNAILSHGIAAFMKESMMERSDKYKVDGVNVPYTFKLFTQEMQTMSIDMIKVKDTEQEMYTIDHDEDIVD
jgi:DNA-directed RNA polymerase beta subunit